MKLSLSHVLGASLALAACDVHIPNRLDVEDDKPPTAKAAAVTPRRLVEGTSLPTSPVNLIADPGFFLVGQETSYGSFLAFFASSFSPFSPRLALASAAPSGFGGAVLHVEPPRATDTKSDAIILLTSFPGGNGPFVAELWASKSDAKGEPTPMPPNGSAFLATIADGSPEAAGYDLVADPEGTRTVGSRTWVRFRGTVTAPLTDGAFFVVTTGRDGGHVQFSAPSVTSAEVTPGGAVQQARGLSSATLARRALRGLEREAIAKYRRLPPRLAPAPNAVSARRLGHPRPGL